MTNHHDEYRNVLIGAVIGGLVGGAALYLVRTTHSHGTPFLGKIGKTLSQFGEMLESSHPVEKAEAAAHEVKEKIVKNGEDAMSSALDWAKTGLHLWKTLNSK